MSFDGAGVNGGPEGAPAREHPSLVGLLRDRAEARPDRGVYAFSADGSEAGEGPVLTLGGLDARARALGAWLQERGLAGERVLMLFPPGLEFVTAFFGCLYAGSVAVPASIPRPNRPMDRLRAIVDAARPAALLTTEGQLPAARQWLEQVPALGDTHWLGVEAVPEALAANWCEPDVGPDSLAFLQYTSGSTASPKGVMLTHGNLLHNSAVIRRSFGAGEGSRGVFWLPLFHDMGLIGGVLQTLFCGGYSTLMSPVAFLQRPVRWLEAISRTGATISGGPNFAYDLCARRVTDGQKAGLDLSRWSVAFNGAEPVRAETLDRFAEAFAPCGFRREAFLPCYGLAESTLIVTGKRAEESPRIFAVRGADLERDRAVEAFGSEPGARVLVGSGRAFDGLRVAVVDPETARVRPDAEVGEVWVSGPSVAAGYWARPEATAETFAARPDGADGSFLRTGDLGFLRDGELFVTGRLKDLIIVRGRNVYPQDVEWSAAHAHPLARAEGGAAFSVEVDGDERLVVVQEVERLGKGADPEEVVGAIRKAVAEQHDLDLHAVCLIRAMSLPKTSSGKVQRHACRAAFLSGTLAAVATSVRAVAVDAARPPAAESPARSAEEIERWLVARLAGTLGLDPTGVDVRRPFAAFGLGSMQAVGLAGELELWLDRPLAPTLIYDHPTVEDLARHLAGDRPEVREAGPAVGEVGPVAVVGIGCRFPGADGPDAFWDLLGAGVDAVGEPPASRRGLGQAGADRAGFLDRVDLFDADFFGIAPREAVFIDPQQRLLLEVAWEAMEDAGLDADRLRGRDVGVFVGVSTNDYGRGRLGEANEAYAVTGNALSVAANRISYAFDFRGPSLAVDTACSSSLVALHLACESLRRGETSVALAGGVNVVLDRAITGTFAAGGFLAPDGKCKAFDASADGYVRGEGAGVVVLKPLAAALADGDPVYAVVRGSAVNQDGRSNGLTAPNRDAQEAVLHAAYRRAGVSPGAVDYVEAHGTGTLLGDPIEAAALAAVVAVGRPEGTPCAVGSVKTNIGHLEAAAGVAGVIKVALSLSRGSVPQSLHFRDPNPHIPFAALPIRVQAVAGPWPDRDRAWLAGVSAFGFGGTNAHAVLEAPPRREPVSGPEGPFLVPLSARTPNALRDLARAYRGLLARADAPALADVAHTAGARRAHHDHRLAFVARTGTEALERLDAFLRGETRAGLSAGRRPPGRRPRAAFVCSGQGSQWRGMGQDLAAAEPVFRAALDECDRHFRALLGWSVVEEIAAGEGASRLEETGYAQPAVFAVQVALLALWRSWGVEPDAVTGHSLGEAAAAFAAGALSLGDAARVVAQRARLMQRVVGRGKTAAVALPEAEAARVVAVDPERLALAGVNGPDASVISGDADAVLSLVRTLRGLGVLAKVLKGDCAFHSPHMDPLCGELREALAGLSPVTASVPVVSTVTGRPISGAELGADYWVRNLRETVRFADAAGHLAADAFDAFLEVGPHPALAPALTEILDSGGRTTAVLGSIRSGEAGRDVLLGSLAELYARGFPVDWTTVNAGGRFCRLPTYPFQRERFWLDVKPAPANGVHALPHANGNGHPGRNGHAAPTPADAPHAEFFEIEWQPRERTIIRGAGLPGTWLIVGDGGGVGTALRARLDEAGARCVPGGPEDAIPLGPLAGVVDLRCLDASPTVPATADGLDAAARAGCEGVVALARRLGDGRTPGAARLWVVTAGAQPAGDRLRPLSLAQAPAWGLGRSIALDRPGIWGGLVDLDPDDLPGGAASLAAELLGPAGEDQVAYRLGKRYVARLVRRQRLDELPGTLPVRPEGTYLVTGGLGELGLKVARRLVEQGARRVVLVGRGGLPDRSEWGGLPEGGAAARRVDEVRSLERLGATVYVAAVDVADAGAMAALFADLRRLFPPVRGVVHAAGVVTPETLANLDPESLALALRPKVAGTWVLHEQTLGLPLDFFVAFSSVASVLGAREAHYAAANQFLDAFAHHRRALGLPALSVNWGPWEGPGMAAGADRGRAFAALGVRPLRVDDGLDALAGLVASGATQAVVADADWHALHDLFAADGRRPLLDDLADRGRAKREGGRRFDWRGGSPEVSRGRLVGFLRDRLAGVLKLDPERVDTGRPLDSMGLDSLMAIELKNGVESELGAALPLASLLQGPSLDRLAATLFDQLSRGGDRSTPIEAAPPTDAEVSDAPLTAGQRALWSLHHIDPESPAYNIVGAVRIAALLDPGALRRTAQRLVDRHPALRTTLPADRGEPVQRVRRRAEAAFRFEDASDADPAELLRRLNAEANRPFDLGNGPLFRIHLFRRSEDDHALVLAMHHAVGDFWSVAVLLDEIGRIYPAELAGREPNLPALPVSYADFARWQRAMLDGAEGRRHWEYWSDRLAGPLPVLNLPTDRPRPPVQTFRGAATITHLDADLTPRLVELGGRRGASLYATLLTAFQVLLARYSGQDDVIVGAPVAGRNRSEVSGVVGYFVNTLPVRTKVEAGLSFSTLLAKVSEAVVGGLDHQDFPFAVMADRVLTTRDPSRPAVFSVMFVLQKAQRLDDQGFTSFVLKGEGPSMELGGFPVESIALEGSSAQFDLTMQVAEDRGRLAVSVEYNTDLFDAATIDRLLGHYRVLLGAAADDPDRPVGDLPLLTTAERERIDGWNAAETSGEPTGFPELFEQQAERTPVAVAVAAADGTLSYRTLNARANRLAHRLQALGVGPESRVAVCVGRSAAAPVAVLGVLKAGGAYVPLDPEYPADRLAFMVADSGAGVIVTDEASRGVVPEGAARVVVLDDSLDGDDRNPGPAAGPDDLAYMIYTSGSTGTPKGVLVTRRNLAHSTHARFLYYKEPVAGYLLVSSFAFDSSVAGIFWTLAQGGKLVIPAPGEHADPLALAGLVGRHAISHFLGVPSLYALILENAPAADLAGLRAVIVAGEPCPRGLPARHFATAPGAALYNEYGPTEATVWATVHRCDPPDPAGGSVPIGRPVAGTRAYVLDARLNPVPVGVTGELFLGGVGLARGYHGRPALTAERFLADPFSGEPGARLYRTGDLARFRPDGLIECLGRADGQVKIRGHRVELGEVEAALAGHPAVRDAAVEARAEPSGETRLVAYLVVRPGAELSAGELRSWLKARLPDAMVPSTFAVLDALPLSPNGKVDRAALPDPSAYRLSGPAPSEAPRNAAEAELSRLAAGLLKVDRVGVHDNVFELGMDSILAIQLVARARKGGLHLTPAQLFQAPTVAGMAEAAGAVPVGRVSGLVPSADDPLDAARRERLGASGRLVEDAFPLTPTQEGMLFHTRFTPGSGVYVQQFACELRGAIDLPEFARAWRRLCDRHAVLRTAFDGGDAGRPLQVVYRGVEPPWHQADWRGLRAGGQADALDDYLRADRRRGFATDAPPLMRLAVFRLGDDAHQLIWSYHHLLFDGWSLPLLLREVLELYAGATSGRPVALPPRPPFRDYVAWLRAEDPARAEPFWRDYLKGFREPTPLGLAGPGGDRDDDGGAYDEQDARLSADTTAALAAQARRRGLTLSTVVQGAWALLLSRYSGRADVVFGSTVSGRSAPVDGVEDMVGLFINTLPVRVTVVGGEPAAAWLARLQGVLVGLRRFEATPLVMVQGWSDVPRGRPLFESLFVFENYPVDASLGERAGGLGVGSVRVDERTHYPLTLMVFPGAELRFRAEYATGRFDPAAVDRLLGHLVRLLEGLADDPDRPIDALPILTTPEMQQLLDQWNDTRDETDPRADRPGAPERAPAVADALGLDHLSDEEVEALIGEYLGREGDSDE